MTHATAIPANIAETLGLQSLGKSGERLIGYWRSEADGGGGPHHRALAHAEAVVRGDITYAFDARHQCEAEIPRLRILADLWDSLPWPGDHVDPTMPAAERECVATMLDSAPHVGSYCGSSADRLAPRDVNGHRPRNGAGERSIAGWIWPDGLSHYVRKYGLRLDPSFLEDVSAALAGPADADIEAAIAQYRAEARPPKATAVIAESRTIGAKNPSTRPWKRNALGDDCL